MAIQVTCQCGKSFNAKPELAGRRVKCPACGSPLQIPALSVPSRDDDPLGLGGFDEQVFSSAPSRRADWWCADAKLELYIGGQAESDFVGFK